MQSLRSLPRAASSIRAFSTTVPRPLAKMQLIGRLAEQPELMPTSTGRELVRYALGVSGTSKDENGNKPVSWFKVASFVEGAQRDLLLSLPKGTQLYVECDAKMDTFQSQDGSNRTALNLLQRNFEMLSKPRRDPEQSTTGAESHASPAEEPLSGVGQS
ncbi:hypothetical protein NU195Hw_g6108t1 [Hortaea werneckii]